MAAPALVALAHGSRDPRSAATINALVAEVRSLRPDLKIERAFLDLAKPSLDTTIDRLARKHDEIVVVPLLLTEAFHAKVDVPSAIAAAAARRPDVQIRATPILGLEAPLPRGARPAPARGPALRPGPRARRPGAGRRRLQRPAGQPVGGPAGPPVGLAPQAARDAAFASSSPPATGEAVRAFRKEGRRHVAVASLFLAPGFLPDRAAELALEAGAVAVSEPLGADPEIARTVLARYAVGAVELVPV